MTALHLHPDLDRVAWPLRCEVIVPAHCRKAELEMRLRQVWERFCVDMTQQGYLPSGEMPTYRGLRAHAPPSALRPRPPAPVFVRGRHTTDESVARGALASVLTLPRPAEADAWAIYLEGTFYKPPMSLEILETEPA